MGDYWSRLQVRLEGAREVDSMRDSERETLRAIGEIASRERRGRLKLTVEQCKDLARIYEADPLYSSLALPSPLRQIVNRYAGRKRNVQMNALLITYLYRAIDGTVELNVGVKMALGLLAMLDIEERGRAAKLANKWRRQREQNEFGGW